ncbi:MAG: two-component regulator propeller domain-containing protein [Acidobacteriota bacterium]
MRQYFLFIFLAILYFSSGGGLALALDPNKAISQYVQDIWKDELPQNSVNAIIQTRDGYIWFGTYEGLVRFNGTHFTIFDQQAVGFHSNGIFALYEDRAGNLWIGTGGGLSCLRNGKFTLYTTADGLAGNVIHAIFEDQAGILWIGTNRGLNLFRDGKLSIYQTKDGFTNNGVRAICADQEGSLWIGSSGEGLGRFRDGKLTTFKTTDGLLNNFVRALYLDRKGKLWIATDGGLNTLSQGKFDSYTIATGLSSNFIRNICEDADGNIWIGTNNGGLNRFTGGRFSAYTMQQGLSQNHVRALLEDREGSLWVGTNGGLNRFHDGKFTLYTAKEELSSDFVRTICQDREGIVWIGTDGGGLNRLSENHFTTYTTNNGLTSNGVRTVYATRDGALWAGTDGGGLNCLRNGKLTAYRTKDGLSNEIINVIMEDRAGNLWVGTYGDGLNRFRDGKFTVYTTRDGLVNNDVRSLYEDRQGRLWIGTYGGLNCLEQGRFTTYTVKDGLASEIIFTFYEDEQGALWIGTDNGLNRFADGKWITCSVKNGLYDNTIFQILPDRSGYLWMSCNKGIFRVRKSELDAFARGERTNVTAVNYGKADGMGTNQCNGATQPAGWRTQDGRLWFATIKGVVVIDPENIKVNQLQPPVVIEQIQVNDEMISSISGQVRLAPGKTKFEFHYAGLSFFATEKVRYKYRLEGFDENWVEAGNRQVAYYTSLPPGNYRFQVTACNNDGLWNEKGTELRFYLQPYFYQTNWFLFLCGLVVASSGVGAYRLRTRQLRLRQLALEDLVAARTKALVGEKDRVERQNAELAAKNVELIALHQRADRIFSALAEVLPGTILDGKYRLDEKIGAGGFGAVYRGSHLTLKREVAVKVFRPMPGNDSAEGLERFQQEAVSACRINHPNAVAVLDSGVANEGIAYLVMELLHGHALTSELSRKKALSVRRCGQILLPICSVLTKAHAAGIVHRDIKPENIFLHQSPEGEVVKVVDFGIAKLMDVRASVNLKNLTPAGRLIGTPTYMAPERFDGEHYDGRSDVYSLGVMLYEMFCGRPPFLPGSGGPLALMMSHLTQPPPPLTNFNPNISPALAAVVMAALVKDPNERPTAKELALQFIAAAGDELDGATTAKLEPPEEMIGDLETLIVEPRYQGTLVAGAQTREELFHSDQSTVSEAKE